jgi:T-complex protein 1 subunit gamma
LEVSLDVLTSPRYFSFIVAKPEAKVHACTILLRGPSKDVMNEIERNLNDAMFVARNVMRESRLVVGGGAIEMSISQGLTEKAKAIEGVVQWPYKALALALEVIPRTLAQNCGSNSVRLITQLRAKHSTGADARNWGVDGNKGEICDMAAAGLWEPMAVKAQTIKTAVEAACMLLRIDDILSGGMTKPQAGSQGPQGAPPIEDGPEEQ